MKEYVAIYLETIYLADGNYRDEEYDRILIKAEDEQAANTQAKELLSTVVQSHSRFSDLMDPIQEGMELTQIFVCELNSHLDMLRQRASDLGSRKVWFETQETKDNG